MQHTTAYRGKLKDTISEAITENDQPSTALAFWCKQVRRPHVRITEQVNSTDVSGLEKPANAWRNSLILLPVTW